MATDRTADVVVVGGGPAGSATALRLARLGHEVVLIDRARFPREKPCSEYMSPEALHQLALLGVLDRIDQGGAVGAGGAALDGTQVSGPFGSKLIGRFALAGGTPFRATGLGLPRRVLDQVLVDAARAAGVLVIEGIAAQQLVRDRRGRVTGVEARDSGPGGGGPHRFCARAVVGADGLGSVVARRAGLHRRGFIRRIALVAHVDGVVELSPITELHVSTGGYVGINALGGGVANVAVVIPVRLASAIGHDPARFFREQLQRFPAVRDRVDCTRIVRRVLTVGPFDAMCRRSATDGVLLVGDAADFFDPFTGEGICTALVGSGLAADCLHEALQRPGAITARVLQPYRAARLRTFLGKWIVERVIGYGMRAPALFDRAVDRLERSGLADTLIGVTGHFVSPWRVLNPLVVGRVALSRVSPA